MDGVIVVDKPCGKTSHDMVNMIRKLTGIKKVGHTGTLDPAATGVLPVCIGKATKAAELLTASDKAYRAELALGMTTDTLDADGEVLTEQPVLCTEQEIHAAVKSFEGMVEQTPPMYSAVKINGKKLYELAREGVEVKRKARIVHIYKIEAVSIDMEQGLVTIDVECSKGTYIRTLCDDIGKKLGCGAYVNRLERTKSGMFDSSQCWTTAQLWELKEQGCLEQAVTPVDALFAYPQVHVPEQMAQRIKNGNRIAYRGLAAGKYRVYDMEGRFLAIMEYDGAQLVLEKAFWS